MNHYICMIMIALIDTFCTMEGACQIVVSSVRPDTVLAGEYYIKGKGLLTEAKYDSSMQYFNNAIKIYEEALTHAEDQELWENYICCLAYKGKNYVKQMKFEPASETLHRALDLGIEKLGDKHIHIALVYTELATLSFRQSELTKALEYDQKSLNIKIQNLGQVHKDVAGGYYNIGLTYQDIGDYDAALSSFIQSRDIYLQLDDPDVASAYYGIGRTYLFKGHSDPAFEPLNKSLTIRMEIFGKNHPLVAESYYALGKWFKDTGDLDEAIDYYKRSTAIYREYYGPQHPSVAFGNNNIGIVYWEKGNIREALHYFDKSLKDKIQIFGENHPAVANTYANIGQIYFRQGDLQKAFQNYNKSLQIRSDVLGNDHPSIAVDYMFMGSAYIEMSEFKKALDYFEKALAIQIKATGEDHPRIAQIYNHMGEIYAGKTDYQKALTYFQKALNSLAPEFNDNNIYHNPPIEYILSDNELLTSLHYKAESLHKLYASKRGNIEDMKMSLRTYQLASELIDEMRSGYKAEGSRLFLGEKVTEIFDKAIQTAITLFKTTMDPYYKEQAFQFAEKCKFSTLALHLQESKARRFSGIPDTLLQQENALRIDIAFYSTQIQKKRQRETSSDSIKINRYEEKLFTLNNQYQKLIKTFEVAYPRYYDLKYQTQTTPVEKLRKLLDDHTVLIEYFTGENTITIFTLTKNNIDVYQTETDSLFYQIANSLVRSIKKVDFRKFIHASVQLHQKLISPVQNKLDRNKKVIIIPHGILAKVPFEVLMSKLPDPSDQTEFTRMNYMIRSYNISYHYSAALYAKSLDEKQERSACYHFAGFAPVFSDDAENNMISADRSVLTDLDYSESDYRAVSVDGKRFNELQYSEKEIREIIHSFERKKEEAIGYFRKDASEENFKANVYNCQYIHIASHGIINEAYPQLSGIIFSQPDSMESQEDGILYSGEIYNLKLNADLVVLSSCESGIGKLVRGEGLMALTRGFLYAGAENLIVSLWKVSDKHTSRLMVELYKYILKGDNYSTALREAKLHMLKNPKTAFPKSWASFVLIGE